MISCGEVLIYGHGRWRACGWRLGTSPTLSPAKFETYNPKLHLHQSHYVPSLLALTGILGRNPTTMSQQRRPEQWSPLGGDVGAAPMPTEPPSPTQRQDHAWQQYAMRPSDQAADIPYPPLAARDYYHNRSMSSATHADAAERAAAFQTAAAAAARSRSATQPSQPRPTTPLDWARYVPPARGYPQSTVPTRLPVRVPQETRDDARVRAIVQALRVDPQGVPATAGEMQQQEQQRQQQQQPSRQPSVMELRPMPSTLRTNPQQWYAGLPPRPSQAAAAAAPSPELLESRPGMTQRQTALSPLNTATSTAPTFGKPEPTAMTATDTAVGSAPSTAGWPTKETVGYVEGAADGPRVLATMGDDGGRGGGVAYAENKRVGTAGAVELDKNVVTWDGPDDPANPANWSMSRKYKTSLILSLFSFIAPFSATMVGPAIDVIGAELEIAPAARQLIQGMQVLAAGIGPFFIAPMVEVYGRADVIRYSHLWHLIWNTACGFSTTGGQLLAFRFVGGLGASAPQILAPGLTADVYPAHMGGRGDAVHAYLPFFGSAIAPIFGAFVSQESNWRWIFWGTSIFSLVAIILAFVALDETYHAVLLERKAARLRKETGNQRLHTPFHPPDMSQRTNWLLKRAALPWIMLVSHPIVQLPFGYRAYLFGIMYLIISTFDRNFMDFYGMDRGSASLNYLALGIGFVVGLHISRYAIDGFSAYFRRKHNTTGHRPEWRLPVNSGAAILLPPALVLYGWGLKNGLHYIVVDLSAFILAIGLILGFFSLQPYVTESYGLEYAASAHCVGAFLQHIAEFAFPLAGPPVTGSDLGFGWGYTMLAAFTLAVCVMMPMLLWHFGPAIRRVSTKGLPVDPSARR
ncbi:hypothetical protein RB595_004418 [Gaeumannomyces hyphopodioides]